MSSLAPSPFQGLPLNRDTARALPLQRGLPLQRPDWPAGPKASTPDTQNTARRFEAMILEQLLATTRNARLGGHANPLTGDTPLNAGSDSLHQQIDRHRAALIASSTPLGTRRLLEAAPR